MKFSFVNPPLNQEVPTREKKMIGASPPMGILYVATYLKTHGVEVSVLDATARMRAKMKLTERFKAQ